MRLRPQTFVALFALALGSFITTTVHSGITAHGKVLAILTYAFSYIESVIATPLFYPQALCPREIATHLKG